MSAQSTGASRTMATARKVENACRSRRLAGTRSMPAGQRSRTAASAAVLLELEAGDEADDLVCRLLLEKKKKKKKHTKTNYKTRLRRTAECTHRIHQWRK